MRRFEIRADVRLLRKEILRAIYEMNQGGKPFTIDEIADHVGCAGKTVQLHIGKLSASGYLDRESGKGSLPNKYKILKPGCEVLGMFSA